MYECKAYVCILYLQKISVNNVKHFTFISHDTDHNKNCNVLNRNT